MELVPSELGLATRREAPTIAAMSRDYIERGLRWRWRVPAIENLMASSDTVVLCARVPTSQDKSIAGFGIMQYNLEEAHLILLAVRPRMRRRGLARDMLAWLEKTAETAGIRKIELEVRERNSGAREFYRTQGYKSGPSIPRYYDGMENAVRMAKRLR
ncbi:MAG: GNAT family N-acetyltransferase [Gammaproteobacteria bacterium]|nr:GNAT family N-acetyltransferase [Gammaproteobacteria bacterium]